MTGPPGDAQPPAAEPSGQGVDPPYDYPPYPYPPQGHPYPYPYQYPVGPVPPARAGQVKAGPAILGFLIGAFTSAGGLMVTTLVLLQSLDARSTGTYSNHAGQASLIASSLFGAAALALLAFPKTRRSGAGLLAGLAVGTILLAGVCAAIGVAQ